MISNMIFGKLPEDVVCGGKSYRIYTDFRIWMKFETILFEEEGEFYTKLPALLKLCYPVLPDTLEEAVFGMLCFYLGKEPEKSDVAPAKKQRKLYSFSHDSALIYAGFYQQYGIDLMEEKFHWFQFKALFDGLSDDTKFVKVVGYRATDVSQFKSPEMRGFYHTMKRIYRLPDRRTEQERQAEILSALETLF